MCGRCRTVGLSRSLLSGANVPCFLILNLLQFSSVSQLCLTLCDSVNYSTPGLPVHHQLLELPKLMSIESVMRPNHLILGRPLLLPSIFPSIRVFSNESVRIRWPKYWSFSFNISPSNEHSGLSLLRMHHCGWIG